MNIIAALGSMLPRYAWYSDQNEEKSHDPTVQIDQRVKAAIVKSDPTSLGNYPLSQDEQDHHASVMRDALTFAYAKQATAAVKQAIVARSLSGRHKEIPTDVMNLALAHKDEALLTTLLRHGADPRLADVRLCLNDKKILETLHFSQRINELYAGIDDASQLDGALKNLDKQAALRLLKDRLYAVDPDSYKEIKWHGWTKKNAAPIFTRLFDQRPASDDILRAMVMLLKPEILRTLRLPLGHDHHALERMLQAAKKETPYTPSKHQAAINLNGEVYTQGRPPVKLVCCLLSTHQAMENKHGKFDVNQYQDEKSIADSVPENIADLYRTQFGKSNDVHHIATEKLGEFLFNQFQEMHKTGLKKKSMLFETVNHTMSMAIELKDDGYAVKFFDPNRTNTHVRVKSADIKSICMTELSNFGITPSVLKHYNPNGENVVTITAVGDESELWDGNGDRKLRTRDAPLTSTTLWQIARYGFTADLKELLPEFEALPEKKRTQFLSTIHDGGTCKFNTLGSVCTSGSPAALATLTKFLQLVPVKERAALLRNAYTNGDSIASEVTCYGQDMILAYGTMIELIPPPERSQLFYNKDGTSILNSLQAKKNSSVFNAWCDVAALLPLADQKALLLARDRNGNALLKAAMKKDEFNAINRYPSLLMRFDEKDWADLILDAGLNQSTPLYEALLSLNPKMIDAYRKMLLLVPNRQLVTDLINKEFKNENGPVLNLMMTMGSAEAITACTPLLKLLPVSQRVAIMQGVDQSGRSSMMAAMEYDKGAAIIAFGALLDSDKISQSKIYDLLATPGPDGLTPLHVAMAHGNDSAIMAFGTIFQRLPADMKLGLLLSKGPDGASPLDAALSSGHAQATTAYFSLVGMLPPEQRAAWLAEQENKMRSQSPVFTMTNLSDVEQLLRDVEHYAQQEAQLINTINQQRLAVNGAAEAPPTEKPSMQAMLKSMTDNGKVQQQLNTAALTLLPDVQAPAEQDQAEQQLAALLTASDQETEAYLKHSRAKLALVEKLSHMQVRAFPKDVAEDSRRWLQRQVKVLEAKVMWNQEMAQLQAVHA